MSQQRQGKSSRGRGSQSLISLVAIYLPCSLAGGLGKCGRARAEAKPGDSRPPPGCPEQLTPCTPGPLSHSRPSHTSVEEKETGRTGRLPGTGLQSPALLPQPLGTCSRGRLDPPPAQRKEREPRWAAQCARPLGLGPRGPAVEVPSTSPPPPHALTLTYVCSIRSDPVRRDLPALGGASQQVPLLTAGSRLRPSAFLRPRVHGAERPAKRTR